MNRRTSPAPAASPPLGFGMARRLIAATIFGTGAWLAHAPALAQNINDVPMAVKNNVPPNFMFMIDNSGSMQNIVPAAPYDETADYTPSGCTGGNIVGTSNQVDIRVISGGVPRFRLGTSSTNYRHWTLANSGTDRRCFARNGQYLAQLLADNNGGPGSYLPALYTGNYLNWYFGNSGGHPDSGWTDRKRLSNAAVTAGNRVERRVEISRSAAKQVIDTLPTAITGTTQTAVRVGLSTYVSGNGGELLQPMKDLVANANANTATTVGRTTFKNLMDSSRLNPSGNTPLASTLADIGRYFATPYRQDVRLPDDRTVNIDTLLYQDGTDQSGRNSCLLSGGNRTNCRDNNSPQPVTQWCQRNYAFLLTDGRPQSDRAFNDNSWMRDYDGDCRGALSSNCVNNGADSSWDRKFGRDYESAGSDYFDDVAKALFDIDLRPDLLPPAGRTKKNNLRTYVIGFADLQVQNDPLLINTARQGGGQFIAAQDGPRLVSAFSRVFTDAFAKDAASAAVSVANAQITVNNTSYAPSYNSGSWYGDVEAYSIDTSNAAQIRPAIWSARELLNDVDPAERKIATFDGTTGRRFAAGQFTAPASLTADVINYIRGDRSLEDTDGDGTGLRVRAHLLGDIINAEPYVVNYDGGIPIIFQGANDGMLHVFDGRTDAAVPTRGQELWAYVPRAVQGNLSRLTDLAYDHRYFVDATPASAQITGFGAMTRLLVGGLGKGGGAYYGLDITSYEAADEAAVASKVRWEFSDVNLGYSFGTPLIVRTAAGWRVIVSSGYGNGTGGPNGNGDGRGRVWILNPGTGAVENVINTNVGSAGSPSGLAHLSRLANTAPDAEVRYVYGGDLLGNVWRFDLNDGIATRIAELRDTSGVAQPVTAPVEVGPVGGSTTRFYVYVGTGRYLADEDVPGTAGANVWATQRQTMYGLIDDTAVASPTLPNIRGTNGATCPVGGGNGELTCQGLTHDPGPNRYRASTNAVPPTSRGWYLDWPVDDRLRNARVTGKPVITTGGTLAFTVNVPTSALCDPGGSSWFFTLAGTNGGAVPIVSGGSEYYDAGVFLDFALASRVIVVQTAGTAGGGGKVGLTQLSNRDVKNVPIGETASPAGGAPAWRRIYWRQLK
jgi:type IV pilus assembly protein PilY1